MTQPFRLTSGGIIDRSLPLAFQYDGKRHQGFAGDTLASALLANGVHLVGRSFKYHRPRGIASAGVEEPNALVQLARGPRSEPNTRATTLELYDGLVAASQNCWPSVRFDAGAFAGVLSGLLPAGFYYKTFMWPSTPRWWLRYEKLIRHAAGMGRAAGAPDPDHYDHQYAHCDVLVIGGGPAALAAAHSAARAGARVIVCQQSPHWGGKLFDAQTPPGDRPVDEWLAGTLRTLASHPEVTLLSRTTAFGYYDGNLVGAIERITDHLAVAPANVPRQRLWKIRARSVVLASGALERGIAYDNNDLPGTLLAAAALTYVRRYAVRPGSRAVVFTNNDSAYATALALHDAGVALAAIVDSRPLAALRGALPAQARSAGIALHAASAIVQARGRRHVASVDVAPLAGGDVISFDCDLVAVSGGYSPTVHLYSQARGTLRYDDQSASFVPGESPLPILSAGAANGCYGLAAAIAEGEAAGAEAASRAGVAATTRPPSAAAPATSPATVAGAGGYAVVPLWTVPPRRVGAKCFVDLQNDVTVRDIDLAAREGYRAVEHLKRYTTLGMGTDQGKTSNLIGLARMAERLELSIPQVGTTTFRPPYTPVALGAFAGHAQGDQVEPTRHTAMHAWHAEHGARFVNAGLWLRPHSYPCSGESEDDAVNREARNVRTHVGVVDVSTLGKIELQGRDVAELLNRVYINRWDTLAVGRCRYGVMLREDGMVYDDGTTSRLGDTHYLMTTTTANAAAVMQHLERLLQVDWPDLDVHLTSVTEHWAAAALSGPRSRQVLATLVDIDVSHAAFPFLAARSCMLRTASGPVPARLFRISYSGELAYEIHVPANLGLPMWNAVMVAGRECGLMPYGTEAMSTLRIEKGHVVVGAEIDGRTTAGDLGMERLLSRDKWCLGKPLLARPALVAADRWQLVGLAALDATPIPRGAKLVADPRRAAPNPILGHVSSWCYSPNVGAWIALGLLAGGRSRHGETLYAASPLAGTSARVSIGAPCFIDPGGERLRA